MAKLATTKSNPARNLPLLGQPDDRDNMSNLGIFVWSADIDLHPDVVSNAEMGDLFKPLIRKSAEACGETAGEHSTIRDAIRLDVDLFAEDSNALTEKGVVRSGHRNLKAKVLP